MRTLIAVVALVIACAAPAAGQTASPSDRLGFDQAGPDLATVRAYDAQLDLDGTVLLPQIMTCEDDGTGSPFACATAIPAVTPGTHTVRLRVVETVNGTALASDWSAPFTFTLRAVPATPTGLRIETTPDE